MRPPTTRTDETRMSASSEAVDDPPPPVRRPTCRTPFVGSWPWPDTDEGNALMHDYQWKVDADEWCDQTPIESYRFRDALDVVAMAEVDRCLGWRTWPEVWHLDDDGKFCCYFRAGSSDSIQRWADDPSPLHRDRAEGLRSGGCPDRWLIVDSRPNWLPQRAGVDESDAAAFVRLQDELGSIGVQLVDVVIFDDDQHRWSLHELTTGTTRWPAPAAA